VVVRRRRAAEHALGVGERGAAGRVGGGRVRVPARAAVLRARLRVRRGALGGAARARARERVRHARGRVRARERLGALGGVAEGVERVGVLRDGRRGRERVEEVGQAAADGRVRRGRPALRLVVRLGRAGLLRGGVGRVGRARLAALGGELGGEPGGRGAEEGEPAAEGEVRRGEGGDDGVELGDQRVRGVEGPAVGAVGAVVRRGRGARGGRVAVGAEERVGVGVALTWVDVIVVLVGRVWRVVKGGGRVAALAGGGGRLTGRRGRIGALREEGELQVLERRRQSGAFGGGGAVGAAAVKERGRHLGKCGEKNQTRNEREGGSSPGRGDRAVRETQRRFMHPAARSVLHCWPASIMNEFEGTDARTNSRFRNLVPPSASSFRETLETGHNRHAG
jgi:hypothetical protein